VYIVSITGDKMNVVNRIIGGRRGHNCDECGHYLNDNEYDRYGSWSYRCKKCGFRYKHGG